MALRRDPESISCAVCPANGRTWDVSGTITGGHEESVTDTSVLVMVISRDLRDERRKEDERREYADAGP